MRHAELPKDREEFSLQLAEARGGPASEELVTRLFVHFSELRRWGERVDLVGPGAWGELLERHYAESLAALPLLPEGAGCLVDLGSGAGFPGYVLAAARTDLATILVEPRERRSAFLSAVVRRAGLAARCLNARVSTNLPPDLPARIDVFTVRALRLPAKVWAALAGRLTPAGRVLVWAGPASEDLGAPLRRARRLRLAGSGREIVEYRLSEEG